jgi:hypothetical protein
VSTRKLDAAPLISALGGLILVVSLFLHWYEPALTAWRVFEVLDLVLATLGIAALWAGISAVAAERPLGDLALAAIGGAAFVVVVSQLINHPPAAQGAGLKSGAWLALAGSALMAVGGLLGVAGVSLSVSFSPRRAGGGQDRSGEPAPAPAASRRGPSPANEAAAVEPEVQDELYPEQERRGPIGADDPEPWTASPDDETLAFEPERDERT